MICFRTNTNLTNVSIVRVYETQSPLLWILRRILLKETLGSDYETGRESKVFNVTYSKELFVA
jgi:hypothetical protein